MNRQSLVDTHGEDYAKGVDLASDLLTQAGLKKWSQVQIILSKLDADNDRMMEGYNDRVLAICEVMSITPTQFDQMLNYIDRQSKKGLN